MQKPPIVNPFEGGFHQSALRRAKKDLAIVKFKEGGFFFFNMPGKSESTKNVNQKGTRKRKKKPQSLLCKLKCLLLSKRKFWGRFFLNNSQVQERSSAVISLSGKIVKCRHVGM